MSQLQQILEAQGHVARSYSPLCAGVLAAVAAQLARKGPLASQVEDYFARVVAATDLEKSLRVAAVLHRYVLCDDARVAPLREFYATVGGTRSPEGESFTRAVEVAIDALGAELFEAALAWRVQTNESARGLAWLFPLSVLDVDAVHLVELGASAGLSLYADERSYTLRDEGTHAHFGRHPGPQFEVDASGLDLPADLELRSPEALTRQGGDAHPIDVNDADDMDILRACIWGDQPARFQRLEEALDLHRAAVRHATAASSAQSGSRSLDAPALARVHRSTLPEAFDELMEAALPTRPAAPIVVFNTYVTAYFSDVEHRQLERKLRAYARTHSLRHRVPWVWVRFEPARRGEARGPKPAWCRWRVELWSGREYRQIDLGWAHPHMSEVRFGEGLAQLLALREQGPQ